MAQGIICVLMCDIKTKKNKKKREVWQAVVWFGDVLIELRLSASIWDAFAELCRVTVGGAGANRLMYSALARVER